ncbi:hypothetical protein DAPPUDRAFT_258092 [Daphnia pulex]|uniref:Uncharacterized protein n=1 Tax=Daphnia pulex TaxID=6669 RepID=E9HES4_DAPPU|nr:hypothetical protein DAPPUDRAFT_258092 [Daphnia pulex]|eukprot:EFX69721.1 hypothetical protein DAPPUDRAFT_258092 [Daphnia pulex]
MKLLTIQGTTQIIAKQLAYQIEASDPEPEEEEEEEGAKFYPNQQILSPTPSELVAPPLPISFADIDLFHLTARQQASSGRHSPEPTPMVTPPPMVATTPSLHNTTFTLSNGSPQSSDASGDGRLDGAENAPSSQMSERVYSLPIPVSPQPNPPLSSPPPCLAQQYEPSSARRERRFRWRAPHSPPISSHCTISSDLLSLLVVISLQLTPPG